MEMILLLEIVRKVQAVAYLNGDDSFIRDCEEGSSSCLPQWR